MGAIAMMMSSATGSAGVAGGHKWWRAVGVTGSATIAFSAMLFKDHTGATISPSGGTALESGHSASDTSANLFDGNDATFWDSAGAGGVDTWGHWCGIEFATTQKVRQIALQRTASMAGDSPPEDVLFQCSDDGITWATVAVGIVGSLTNDVPKWFDFTNVFPSYTRTNFGAHAYWRLRDIAPQSAGSWTALSAMLFKDDGGSAVATTGGSALESAHFSTFDSSKLFDSTDATFWESSNIGYHSWAGYQFSTTKTIMQIALQRTASMDGSNPPTRCTFEYSDDGITWAIATAVEVGSLTNDVPTWFDLTVGL